MMLPVPHANVTILVSAGCRVGEASATSPSTRFLASAIEPSGEKRYRLEWPWATTTLSRRWSLMMGCHVTVSQVGGNLHVTQRDG